MYILPRHHSSLTQPITYKESHILIIFVAVLANDIVFARFEDFTTFLYVFMGVVRSHNRGLLLWLLALLKISWAKNSG